MEQRVSFITLAVTDVARSRAFYVDGLGWQPIFEADEVLMLAEAERLGAKVQKASRRDWGGYSGYFADPDGFRWEIAVNPGETGAFVLPPSD